MKKLNLLRWSLLFLAAAMPSAGASTAIAGHKVEVRNTADARIIEARGGRLIADYGGFQLYNVPEVNNIPATAEVRDRYNLIRLNASQLDTSKSEIQAMRKRVGTFSGRRMHLVQFAGPVQTSWRKDLLDAGVQIVSYIPNNTYLVYGDSASIGRVQDLAGSAPHIQWDAAYLDDYKIHPNARTVDKQGHPRKIGMDRFAIQLMADPSANADTLKLINQLALAPVQRHRQVLNFVDIIVRLPASDLAKIAARPDVVSIQPYALPRLLGERQDIIVTGNITNNAPSGAGYLAWLESKGFSADQFTNFVVDVSDSGIDNGTTTPNHFGLYVGGVISAGTSRVVYNILEGTPNNPGSTLEGCDGHGNLNAHIVMGYDNDAGSTFEDTSDYHYGLGVCPFVSVGSSVIFDPEFSTNPDDITVISTAYQHGARISNNSWGEGDDPGFPDPDGTYNEDCFEYDALVRDAEPSTAGNQEMVIVFAAGNDGHFVDSVSPPGTAKNVITVGAAENVQAFGGDNDGEDGSKVTDSQSDDANAVASFSSVGPCGDGRHKPDIMAPGTHVSGGAPQAEAISTGTGDALACFDSDGTNGVSGGPDGSLFFPLNQQFYTASTGTSHSTPCVTGGCALVRQYFINNSLLGTNPPSPAMTKAFLMNSARYMTSTGADDTLWSDSQGMGEMDLGMAFDETSRFLRDEAAADTFSATGQMRVFTGVVGDTTKPFRVTIAWTDAPGSTTGASYNNDLDLTVTVGGNTYLGNVFSGSNSIPGGAADEVDNVESVFLPAGVSGNFTVTVTAANINSIGVPNPSNQLSQDFALVVYNAGAAATVAAAGYTLSNGPCGDAIVYPGQVVTASLALQNFGNSSTTNLVATPLAYLLYRGETAPDVLATPTDLMGLLASNQTAFPSGPQNYGALAPGATVSKPFSFIADGSCGDTIDAILQLQDGSVNLGAVTYSFQLGAPYSITNSVLNFDETETFPSGWSTSVSNSSGNRGLSAWTIEGTNYDTNYDNEFDLPPYAAHCPDAATAGNVYLYSSTFALNNGPNQLSFRNAFNLEPAYDGGVLEIAINGGAFADILTNGGSFVIGGYNGTLTDEGDTTQQPDEAPSPLLGRQAWTGGSDGFITTIVNLPPAASGSTVQFRWICGTDDGNAGLDTSEPSGWWIDNISLSQPFFNCSSCPATNGSITTILFPTNGYNPTGVSSGVVVTGQAPDNSTVSISNNGVLITTASADGNGVYAALATLDFGSNILTASAGGNVSGSIGIFITPGPPDFQLPSIVNTNVTITGTGAPGAVVDLYQGTSTNSAPLAIFMVNSSGSFSGSVTLPLGVITLTAVEMIDGQASTNTTPISVLVVATPAPIITSPVNGSVTNRVSVKIAGKGMAGASVVIHDIVNGATNTLATITVSRNATFSTEVKLANGTNTLFATQDGSNSPPSAPVVIADFLSPQFLLQPQSQTNFLKGTATFTAEVVGAAPLKLFWQRNGTNIRGATSAKLILANLSSADSGNYDLLASNSYGERSSADVAVVVVDNPFPGLSGAYYGLFTESNPQFESSGFLSLTLTTLGKYTARILNAGAGYSISGSLSGVGWGTNSISRGAGKAPLSIILNLNTTDGSNEIVGSVSAGTNWTANLEADRAGFSAASPFASHGKYTLLFGNANGGAQSPGGDGFATVSISAAGVVSMNGFLSDNTPFAPGAVSLSKGSRWPLYVPLYGRFGSLVGWIGFTNPGVSDVDLTNAASVNFAGPNVMWFRTNADGKLYSSGFTNSLTVIGSKFSPDDNPGSLGLTNMEVILSGGDLPAALSNSVVPLSNGKFVINAGSIPGLTFTLAPSTGVIKGSFADPSSPKPAVIRGVMLQDQNNAAGFFLGGTNSGSFLLTP